MTREQAIELHNAGTTWQQIAGMLGMSSRHNAWHFAHYKPQGRPTPRVDHGLILRWYARKMPANWIAAEVGCSRQTVYRVIKAGYRPPERKIGPSRAKLAAKAELDRAFRLFENAQTVDNYAALQDAQRRYAGL